MIASLQVGFNSRLTYNIVVEQYIFQTQKRNGNVEVGSISPHIQKTEQGKLKRAAWLNKCVFLVLR